MTENLLVRSVSAVVVDVDMIVRFTFIPDVVAGDVWIIPDFVDTTVTVDDVIEVLAVFDTELMLSEPVSYTHLTLPTKRIV